VYESKTEAHEFVGADKAEAVAKAVRFFELGEEELSIAELSEAGVYGLGGRALIVALPRGARRPTRGGGGGGGREAREGREDRGPRERGDRERGGRGRGRDRDRGDRGASFRDRDRGGDRDREPRRAEPMREPERETLREPVGPSVGTRVGEVTGVGEFVCGLVERMDVGPFEIEETSEDELCVVQLRGPGAVELTHGDGRAVDAIQLLANQAALQIDEESPRVVVDVEGDREAREAYLEDLARRAAERAVKTGHSIALDPMNPKARRVLHVALRGSRDVATMSTGSGRYRQVVVVPKGAPEYEDAVRYAEEAARNES
jgi:predicted RNA-binding protein Jag